ncbi:K(+)/H(+) antiporter [Massospora cicadina]|nr:K(+)/H(+) antiporter [Massospora cicadina]
MKGGIGFLSGENPFQFDLASPLPMFIIQMLIITVACRLIKLLLTPLRQPSVIAEVVGGIVLGPTVLGRIPGYRATIFPDASLPFLNLMSNFGLVLFLFLVGLELDPLMISRSFRKSLAISFAGMALPFALGAGVSFGLYNVIEPGTNPTPFMTYLLFLGVAMSITAFPVLARILTELGLLLTPVGSITISAAAVDDAASWCLLALVISLIRAGTGLSALWVFLMGLGYTLLLAVAVRPCLIYLCRRAGAFESGPSQAVVFICLALVFFSALVTHAIGIDAIFGGFVAGVIMPHEGGFARHITEKLEDLVTVLFLPLYFTLSGLKTQLGFLDDGVAWGMALLVLVTACAGKLTGCALAAKATGLRWRESLAIGVMMNCKGLVELIVLNLGLDAGVISPKTFAIMVIMALVTTFLTVPLIAVVYPKSLYAIPADGAGELCAAPARKVVVCVNNLVCVPALMSLVQALASGVGLDMTALRLLELTERPSTIMLQAEAGDSARMDPVASIFHAFAQLTAVDLRTVLRVVRPSDFATAVSDVAREAAAELVIIPWCGSGATADNLATPPPERVIGLTELAAASGQNAAFLRAAYNLANPTSSSPTPLPSEHRRPLLWWARRPRCRYVGCVLLALNSHLTVVRFLPDGDLPAEPVSIPAESQVKQSKAEDDALLDTLFGSSTALNSSRFTYTCRRAKHPVSSALEALGSFTQRDVVFVGRNRLETFSYSTGPGSKHGEAECQSVFGHVGESILQSSCFCSVLVVQESPF